MRVKMSSAGEDLEQLQLLKPTCSRAHALEPMLYSKEATTMKQARAPQLENSPCLLELQKNPCSNEDPAQLKINK